jgi:hypothetical protein
MISWNPSLQGKYVNLLILAEIARMQCVSTAACKRAFSVQNCIKSKFRNRLKTQYLESVLRIVLEGPKEGPQDGCESLLVEAIGLWKRSTKYRYLYSDPERYLAEQGNIGGVDGDLEDLPNF